MGAAEEIFNECEVCIQCGNYTEWRNLRGLSFTYSDGSLLKLDKNFEAAWCAECNEALMTPEQDLAFERALWLTKRDLEKEKKRLDVEARTFRVPGIAKPIILTKHVINRWGERYCQRLGKEPVKHLSRRFPNCKVASYRGGSLWRLKKHGEFSVYLHDEASDMILVLAPKLNALLVRTVYKASDCRWRKSAKWERFKDYEWWVL